jgi:hypothetical protein
MPSRMPKSKPFWLTTGKGPSYAAGSHECGSAMKIGGGGNNPDLWRYYLPLIAIAVVGAAIRIYWKTSLVLAFLILATIGGCIA